MITEEERARGISECGTLIHGEPRTKCEVWTRVMGYYRPTTWYNTGKKQEHKDRTFYIEPGDKDYDNHQHERHEARDSAKADGRQDSKAA